MKGLFKHRHQPENVARRILTIAFLSAGLSLLGETQPVVAQNCNPFGCSQPGAGSCNPFGCPNPGAGPCTPFGCPAAPNPPAVPTSQPSVIYQPQPQAPVIYQPQPQMGGSPQAIADCMRRLMYEERPNLPGLPPQRVRTQISEATAVQACQNAR